MTLDLMHRIANTLPQPPPSEWGNWTHWHVNPGHEENKWGAHRDPHIDIELVYKDGIFQIRGGASIEMVDLENQSIAGCLHLAEICARAASEVVVAVLRNRGQLLIIRNPVKPKEESDAS